MEKCIHKKEKGFNSQLDLCFLFVVLLLKFFYPFNILQFQFFSSSSFFLTPLLHFLLFRSLLSTDQMTAPVISITLCGRKLTLDRYYLTYLS